jgi:hypothetical protein
MMMDIKRAILSFSVAALAPGVIAIITQNTSSDWLANLLLFAIFYLIYLVIILCIGFPTLFLALRVRLGPVFFPPLVGGLSGLLIAKSMYNSETSMHSQWLLVINGVVTAVIAALIYFRPWSKPIARLSANQ